MWLAVGVGGAVGLVGAAWERFLLVHRRAEQLAFHRAPAPERLGWRFQRANLRQNGWFLLVLLSLIGWCAWSRVFVLPPLLASNAVMFAVNRRLAGVFRAELVGPPEAAPSAPTGS